MSMEQTCDESIDPAYDQTQIKTPDRAAATSPNFVIEDDGRYYIAVAVLEYDPDAENITEEERRGVDQVRQLFETSVREAPVGASRLNERYNYSMQNTRPPRPRRPQ